MTTVVGGCNKLAILEFWSKFNADRERLNEGAEPLPAEAAGAVVEAMAGRLVNVRLCVNGMVGRETEVLGGPIGLVMRVGSELGGWSIVP
jgi:hypothetical protein